MIIMLAALQENDVIKRRNDGKSKAEILVTCLPLKVKSWTPLFCRWSPSVFQNSIQRRYTPGFSISSSIYLMISKFLFSSHHLCFDVLLFFANLYNSKSHMTLKDSIYVNIWHINVEIGGWRDENLFMKHHLRSTVQAPHCLTSRYLSEKGNLKRVKNRLRN